MARALFDRRVSLNIGTTEGGEARELRDLRVSFRVIMTATSLPFEAQVELFNPSDTTVAACRRPDAQIELVAGYQTPGVIFRGEPILGGVRRARQGPDSILSLDLADRWKVTREAWFDREYAAQTNATQVVEDAIAAMGLPVGFVEVPGNLRWPRGVSFSGRASDVLDEVAESVGASWRVDGGVVVFAADQTPTVARQGPLITADSGMVGSPTLRGDVSKDAIEVRSLLLPDMRPGRPFRVQSEDISGNYIARDVMHVGDSGYDQPFYTEMIGAPL